MIEQGYSGEDNYADFVRLFTIIETSGDSKELLALKAETVAFALERAKDKAKIGFFNQAHEAVLRLAA